MAACEAAPHETLDLVPAPIEALYAAFLQRLPQSLRDRLELSRLSRQFSKLSKASRNGRLHDLSGPAKLEILIENRGSNGPHKRFHTDLTAEASLHDRFTTHHFASIELLNQIPRL